MRTNSSIPMVQDMEALEYFFRNAGNTYFRIYSGHVQRSKNAPKLFTNEVHDSVDAAWEELADTLPHYLRANPNVKLTIQTSGKQANADIQNIFFQMPKQTYGMQGINGAYGMGMPFGMPNQFGYGMGFPNGLQGMIDQKVKEGISQGIEDFKVKEEIKELKAALYEQNNPTKMDKLLSGLLDNPADSMQKIGGLFIQGMQMMQTMRSPQIAMATPSSNQNIVNQREKENTTLDEQATTEETTELQLTEEQEELILQCLGRLAKHINIVEVLPQLADKLDENPAYAQMLPQFLK